VKLQYFDHLMLSKRAESIDWREWRSELKEYGIALSRGQKVAITKIKTKLSHIEFQLDGGGWGTVTSNTAGWPGEHKSRREKELEREIDDETDRWKKHDMEHEVEELEQDIENERDSFEKRRLEQELEKLKRELGNETDSYKKASMRRELARLRQERSIRNNSPEMKEKINAWEKAKRLAGGSRFNIRYESWLTDGDKTPESVMAALSEYLDFPAVAPPPPPPPPPPPKLYPIDESHLDPSFAEFKTRLLEAVERRDLDFLLSIGPKRLKRNWKAREWQELRDILSLGAVRVSYGFCAPYVSIKFPYALNAFESVVITASDVPIRAEPKSTAPIIEHLSYDIVKYLWRGGWETVEGESYMWYRIQTPSGETGYAWGKYVTSPLDTSACFDKTDGQWLMTSWSGGD